jgi:hypothetical protein
MLILFSAGNYRVVDGKLPAMQGKADDIPSTRKVQGFFSTAAAVGCAAYIADAVWSFRPNSPLSPFISMTIRINRNLNILFVRIEAPVSAPRP